MKNDRYALLVKGLRSFGESKLLSISLDSGYFARCCSFPVWLSVKTLSKYAANQVISRAGWFFGVGLRTRIEKGHI
jgi:hypothetical protein